MFKACFWPQILQKIKFWNLGEKTITKNSHMHRLLKTRTSTSFILLSIGLFLTISEHNFLFITAGPHDEQNDTLHTISLDDTS